MSSEIHDVLIIGGGLSGLSAGNYLFDNNIKKFLILEARDRVGGRTCTIDYNQHPVDVGGAYVGPFQNRILRLAREFNIRTYRIDVKGKNVLTFSNGERSAYRGTIPTSTGVFTLLDLNYLLCRTQELAEQISNLTPWSNEDLLNKYDHMTLEDWLDSLGETNEAKEIYRAAARTILCVEPNEVSMFAWISYINNGLGIMRLCEVENGAQERKFSGGSQQISNRLREKLGFNRVLLNHVVKHIQWSTTDVIQVTCENKKIFSCRHVIIALAPSLYKTIEFQPDLPAKKREATERMYMGSIIKTITVFKRPYWKENGYSGSILDTSHETNPVVFSYDDSCAEDQFYAIMGFIVADSSRKWAKQTREQRRDAVCQQYAQAFQSNDLLTGCLEYIEQNWSAEQFSGGCYTDIMPKDVLSSIREQLITPCGDNGQLFFAGTELATRFSGYMDGAVQAGERAAYELITKYLKKDDENFSSLKWIDEEPVNEKEECRAPDITKLMYGPSKLEMLLPKASKVQSILKITAISLIVLAAIFINRQFF